MRDKEEEATPVGADPFGLVAGQLDAPPPLWSADEERRALISELRSLIASDDYEVDPEAVAEAIIDESGRFRVIDWLD